MDQDQHYKQAQRAIGAAADRLVAEGARVSAVATALVATSARIQAAAGMPVEVIAQLMTEFIMAWTGLAAALPAPLTASAAAADPGPVAEEFERARAPLVRTILGLYEEGLNCGTLAPALFALMVDVMVQDGFGLAEIRGMVKLITDELPALYRGALRRRAQGELTPPASQIH